MNLTEKNKWFYLEPYTYINVNSSKVLIYNTLDSTAIIHDHPEIIDIIKSLGIEANCGVIELNENQLKNESIKLFLRDILQNYMGDLIDTSLSPNKPIQMFPKLNLQFSKDRIQGKNKYESQIDLSSIHEITLFLNGDRNKINNILRWEQYPIGFESDGRELDLDNLIKFIDPLLNVGPRVIRLSGYDIMKYKKFDNLLNYLNAFPCKIYLSIDYDNIDIEFLKKLITKSLFIQLVIKNPSRVNLGNLLFEELRDLISKCEFNFLLESENDSITSENIVKELKISEYRYFPIYNQKNIAFFRDNVFLNEKDILSTTISMQGIFTNQALNYYNFGKLSILPDGNVYAPGTNFVLGNIESESLFDVIFNEMFKGSSWLHIRDQEPCEGCLFQWLCPPPSVYEKVIGKANLCNVLD